MKNVLKKIQIMSIATIVGFGSMSIINNASVQNFTSKQYVLSRYSSQHKLVRSPFDQKPQSVTK